MDMKTLKKISVIAVLILSLCFAATASYAASDLTTAQQYNPLSRASMSASSGKAETRTLRVYLPSAGKITFYADKFSVSDKSTYSILSSKGADLLTSRLSTLKGKTIKFLGGGTYYFRFSLTAGDNIANLLYTYDSDNAFDETHSIALRKGETVPVKKYVKSFKSNYMYIVSNVRIATVKNGQISAIKPGNNTIEAFSSTGEHVKINVFVSDSVSSGIEIQGANMIWKGESFNYTYSYTDGKTYTDHEIVWSVSGNGTVTKKGKLTANAKGDAVLTVTDKTAGMSSSMTVHFISDASEVDFVPTINGIQIANKTYPLPSDYDPGLDKDTLAAYNKMAADAAKEGLSFNIISSYRSYNKQVQTYNHWKSLYGKAEADRCSARPGFSEHQLGLAIDVNSCYTSFAYTKEGKWLAKNCWKYGFILRYPSVAAEKITGYIYEPWHIRYVGTELAKKLYQSGQTLEEYLGVDSYYRQ